MKVLLLSLGGGGGNILRSLKALFERDLQAAETVDAAYAGRLRDAVSARFLDTNEFSLSDIPQAERLLIGAGTTGRLGSRHNPEVARAALEESRAEVEALLHPYAAVILIGTGGKGTGAGTIFPVAQMARAQRKLVIPIFVRPSFERHEVEKRRYDHAVKVVAQFDAAQIRLIEILNDRGYADAHPLPQSVVWEQMNLPIARGLRGLLYVLEDLSQVDPSDLAALFAGSGRLRLGYAEIDPPADQDPTGEQIEAAVRACWANPYDAFSRPAGTSLICIQGHWSNVVDARIKGRLSALVSRGAADSPYNPLYARAIQTPRPWGITALFAEDTGAHPPLEIAWTAGARVPTMHAAPVAAAPPRAAAASAPPPVLEPAWPEPPLDTVSAPSPAVAGPAYGSLWEFALAVNRGEAAAIALAANGANGGVRIDAAELRKLLSTVWFRSVFARLSEHWRDRLFETVKEGVPFQNHVIKVGRQLLPLGEISHAQLKDLVTRTDLPDPVRMDMQVLIAVGRLWGDHAVRRCQFVGDAPAPLSTFGGILQGWRG